jgi:hypothetical protein
MKGPGSFILLIIWQFIAASFWLIGIIAAAVFAFPFSPGYEGTSVEVGDVFGMIVGTLFLLGCIGVAIASGIGLVKGKRWGRLVSIVNAALSLMLVPIGTIAGILVLIYLMKPEVRKYFNVISENSGA